MIPIPPSNTLFEGSIITRFKTKSPGNEAFSHTHTHTLTVISDTEQV